MYKASVDYTTADNELTLRRNELLNWRRRDPASARRRGRGRRRTGSRLPRTRPRPPSDLCTVKAKTAGTHRAGHHQRRDARSASAPASRRLWLDPGRYADCARRGRGRVRPPRRQRTSRARRSLSTTTPTRSLTYQREGSAHPRHVPAEAVRRRIASRQRHARARGRHRDRGPAPPPASPRSELASASGSASGQ